MSFGANRGVAATEIVSLDSAPGVVVPVRQVLSVAAILSIAAEAVIGLFLFRWWVALVVGGGVTLMVDLAALGWRPRTAILLGALLCLAGAVAMLS